MLSLNINGDIYKLYSDIKRQMKLKRELLVRYAPTDKIVIKDHEKIIDECTLDDFCGN